jgi:hypothetical protein
MAVLESPSERALIIKPKGDLDKVFMPPNPNCVRTGTNMITESDPQSVLGKRYTRETARHMLHGGVIDGNGIIVRVVTSEEEALQWKDCKDHLKALLDMPD